MRMHVAVIFMIACYRDQSTGSSTSQYLKITIAKINLELCEVWYFASESSHALACLVSSSCEQCLSISRLWHFPRLCSVRCEKACAAGKTWRSETIGPWAQASATCEPPAAAAAAAQINRKIAFAF